MSIYYLALFVSLKSRLKTVNSIIFDVENEMSWYVGICQSIEGDFRIPGLDKIEN